MKIKLLSAAAALSFVAAPIAQAEELTISAWGGFFEETLAEVIYPGFTEATGITVNSIPQPADQAWLTQIANATRSSPGLGFRFLEACRPGDRKKIINE